MNNRDILLEQLQQMLNWKKSKRYYAEKLGISEDLVDQLLREIRSSQEEPAPVEGSFEHNLNTGQAQQTFVTEEQVRTLEDLIRIAKIDTKVWNIDKYIQNYWGNADNPSWQVKVFLSPKTADQNFTSEFLSFLQSYTPQHTFIRHEPTDYPNAMLLLDKQDAHLDKYDERGDNNINSRFEQIESKYKNIILAASTCHNLKEIVYIIGSDQFNSEWTSTTTKGTPQKNNIGYHDGFQLICNHEIRIINEMLQFADKVIIKYVPGNHDEYVGWHLIKWLECYYRNQTNLVFHTSPEYTKEHLFSNSAMIFNHGDVQKPEKLAQDFPVLYKDIWVKADNYYVFVGDKHHLLGKDISSIEFYQIPSLSKAKSKWDMKMGHEATKAQIFAFLFEEGEGMVNIYKKKL